MKKIFRNPFAVQAFFESSLVLAYTAPRDVLAQRLPPYLELDTFGEFGFVAAAFVDTRQLRPHGAPAWLGHDFLLAGYRIFVRYRDAHGRTLRGLYILRSETNRRSMYLLGNLFTMYRYRYTPFEMNATDHTITISSAGGLHIAATIPAEGTPPALPPNSPFSSWREARRYSGPLPFTFSYDAARAQMLIVQGVRQGWRPQPVQVTHASLPTLHELGLRDLTLANGFLVRQIPYLWRAAVIERPPHDSAPHPSADTSALLNSDDEAANDDL